MSARCVAVVRLVGPTVAEIQPLRTVRHPGRNTATGAFSSMYIQYIRRPGISQVSFFQGWHVDDACRILSPGPFRHTFLHTICIYINMLRCVGGRVKDFQKISPHRAMKKTLEYRGRPTGHKKSRPHTPHIVGQPLVFSGARRGRLSDVALTKAVRVFDLTATVHGFRFS